MKRVRTKSWRIDRNFALLLVIDVQEKLMRHIHQQEWVESNVVRLVRGFHQLGVPALLTEQYPRGIGPTTRPVREAFQDTGGCQPIQKACFSGYGCRELVERIEESRRRQLVVCGIETHVCVYQTSMDLLAAGFEVTIVADAVSSRRAENRQIALDRLIREGAKATSTEMVLFELTVESGTEEFRAISKLVK